MNSKKKIILIVSGFVLLSLISGTAAYGFYKNSHPESVDVQPTSTSTVDPITKQTIDDYASHTPENFGTNPSLPSLIGFAAMLDQGVMQTDLTVLQNSISNYFVSSGEAYPPSPVVVLSNARCGFPQDNGAVDCTYTLTVNEKTKLQGTLRTGDPSGLITVEISNGGKSVYTKSMAS